jgi:hypothetical protein
VIQAAIETGSNTGRDGANDRRLLMEVSGVYTPKQQVDLHAKNGQIIGIVGVTMDDL